jgi:hypothetical protein
LEERRAPANPAPVEHAMGKRRIAVAAAILVASAIVFLAAVGFGTVPALDIRDARGHRLATLVLPDGRFDHVFLHSIHRTPVVERFEVEFGSGAASLLRLYELRYQSPGNGMPSESEGEYRLVDGHFVIAMNRVLANIPLIVSIVPGHGVAVAGVFHPFTEWAKPEDALLLDARRVMRIIPRR